MKNLAALMGLVLLVSGCAQTASAPVINKSPSRKIPEAYVVNAGDSIYKIAWAFGLDYIDIAEWNRLKAPYKLKPAQVLRLGKQTINITPLDADSNETSSPTVVKALPAKQPTPKAVVNTAAAKPVKFSSSPGQWNWPAEGKLVGKYSPSKGSNGIQIAGAQGSPVKATAAGEVVYVGQGLRGYGKLIILKHSEKFLSAYAHNQDILVEEGQGIQSGQQIARMGNSGASSTMLHFEIRQDGKPVDPLGFLK